MDIKLLKSIKRQRKITNKELAEKSGVALGTLNRILSGNTSVKLETYNKLKNALESDTNCFNEGTVKVACCNIEVKVGSPLENANLICEKIEKVVSKGVNLIVFPEMTLVGVTAKDLLFQRQLLIGVENALYKIKTLSEKVEALIFVGTPLVVEGNLYNTAVCFCKGKIIGVTPKINLSSEEQRYFSTWDGVKTVRVCGEACQMGSLVYANERFPLMKVGVEISNDLVSLIPPSSLLCGQGANLIVNLSATNEIVKRAENRLLQVLSQSYRGTCAYILTDTGRGESTTDSVWGGHKIIAENGKLIAESKPLEFKDIIAEVDLELLENKRLKNNFKTNGGFVNFELEVLGSSERKYSKTPFIPEDKKQFNIRAEQILNMQAEGLAKRVKHTNSKTLVLGISGGLDSALAMLVCVRACAKLNKNLKDIIAVTMPCFGTSDRTYNNAVDLTEGLGLTLKKVDIKSSVLSHFADIEHDPQDKSVTYENAQARERTQVLMDLANKEWGMVVGTGDLSELALGWATYNGDHMSNYGVNGSIPKTLVKALVLYEADRFGGKVGKCLKDIVDTPVSPELIPTQNGQIKQKTEDLVGPYLLHDFFLYHFLSSGFSPRKIYNMALRSFKGEFDGATIHKWLVNFVRRFFAMQFKRSCLPDGVSVGSVGLSPRGGYFMPSDATSKLWLDEIESINIE